NSHVKAGQVVAKIDPSLFEGAVLQASADLQNAQANVVAAKANAAKADATAEQATAQYKRSQALTSQGVLSEQQLEIDRAAADSDVAAAKSMQAQIGQAQAQVTQKQAALKVAQKNLDYTVIRAPINGTVISRSVDVGQTVAASLQAPTLFQIAQDLTKMQVYTNIDESDVGQIRAGQPVTFTVDAFPKEVFRGRVDTIRLNATTVQNVVTYNTVVAFDNPDLKLFPGMTAYVAIPVETAQDVLRVPNGALRYKPDLKPDEIQKLEQQAGIEPRAAGRGQKSSHQANTGSKQANDASADSFPAAHMSNATILWKLVGKQLQPVQVETGITDHTQTAVTKLLHGTLDEGSQLVTGSASKSASAGLTAGPGMGGAPGARR
ncbi:MAG TPA: efflux RND transporter periplasmic adaptor subunit, partial [Candidatus Angelobacter sp.]|nr:efflux RND transporter periplasmic adaptor subunit [Candidatus Angelobacter sp.]